MAGGLSPFLGCSYEQHKVYKQWFTGPGITTNYSPCGKAFDSISYFLLERPLGFIRRFTQIPRMFCTRAWEEADISSFYSWPFDSNVVLQLSVHCKLFKPLAANIPDDESWLKKCAFPRSLCNSSSHYFLSVPSNSKGFFSKWPIKWVVMFFFNNCNISLPFYFILFTCTVASKETTAREITWP